MSNTKIWPNLVASIVALIYLTYTLFVLFIYLNFVLVYSLYLKHNKWLHYVDDGRIMICVCVCVSLILSQIILYRFFETIESKIWI